MAGIGRSNTNHGAILLWIELLQQPQLAGRDALQLLQATRMVKMPVRDYHLSDVRPKVFRLKLTISIVAPRPCRKKT
jgi:hypothetical protein